jgi:hypothetical protein
MLQSTLQELLQGPAGRSIFTSRHIGNVLHCQRAQPKSSESTTPWPGDTRWTSGHCWMSHSLMFHAMLTDNEKLCQFLRCKHVQRAQAAARCRLVDFEATKLASASRASEKVDMMNRAGESMFTIPARQTTDGNNKKTRRIQGLAEGPMIKSNGLGCRARLKTILCSPSLHESCGHPTGVLVYIFDIAFRLYRICQNLHRLRSRMSPHTCSFFSLHEHPTI